MERNPLPAWGVKMWRRTASLLLLCMIAVTPVAFAASFNIIGDSYLPSDVDGVVESAKIWSVGQSSQGGLLLAGTRGFDHAWIEHISPDLHYDWSTTIAQGWPGYDARMVVDASDGGYWSAGTGSATDTRAEQHRALAKWFAVAQAATFDYIARFDVRGKLLWQKRFFLGQPHRLYCIRETTDGLVALGTEVLTYRSADPVSRVTRSGVPWIAKFDRNGVMLWDHALVDQKEPILINPPSRFSTPPCGIQVAADGRITVAVPISEVTGIEHDNLGVILPERVFEHAKDAGTLVVQVDSLGHELHRIKTNSADSAFLFSNGNELSLVEHRRVTFNSVSILIARLIPQALSILRDEYNEEGAIRVTVLDDKLAILRTQDVSLPAFSKTLSAVLPAVSGGYFMTGCDLSSVNSIVKISPAGAITALQPIFKSPRANQCAQIALTPDHANGVVAFFSDDINGKRLVRLAVQ